MYRVNCPNCRKGFDALEATDCSCLDPVRSFVCPSCNSCFCRAPSNFVKAFWSHAPVELWERRRRRAATIESNEPPDLIERPMVLFADDDPVARAIARRIILSLGFGVAVAADGETALELARLYSPNLLITDAMMPRRDGREVAKLVSEELPDTKIVVITSVYKDPRYRHEAYKRFGVDEYLAKPIKPADLRHLVVKHLATTEGQPQ